jgi:hypothetical protein
MIPSGALLDAYLEWEREWKQARRAEFVAQREAAGESSAKWWASSVARCFRSQIAQKYDIPEIRTIDARTRRTFSWGDLIEGFLRKLHYRCGVAKGTQTRLYDEALSVSAKIDLICAGPLQAVDDIPADSLERWSDDWVEFLRYVEAKMRDHFAEQLADGRVWAKEIKSAKSYKMEKLPQEGPDFSWQMQVGTEQVIAELHPETFEEQGVPTPDVYVVEAIGRDAVGVLTFGALGTWKDTARDRLDYLNFAFEQKTPLEEIPCECKGWMVEYCGFGEPVLDHPKRSEEAFTCCFGGGSNVRKRRYPRRKKSAS